MFSAEADVMNKNYAFLLVLLVSVAGCGKKNKKADVKGSEVNSSVDIPVADDGIRSFFDQDIDGFVTEEAKAEVPEQDPKFKVVYFDFDRFEVRQDQQEVALYDVDQVKAAVKEAEAKGQKPVVVIEGHACHSAGSATYNLALSEKRAKALEDMFVAQGIAKEDIKIVGRGKEVPAIIDGKAVTGSRQEQWPNRRDEIHVMPAA
jgi:peptidoglycan-associated lipoprotein